MSVASEPVVDQRDLGLLDTLIAAEEAVFLARTSESRRVRAASADVLPGGVVSNWQDAPPGTVWISHGAGSRVVDVDGTSYVDLHGGFGVGLAGHAHPAIVEAVSDRVRRGTHFAQPTADAVVVARELARRFGLPLWRFGNSGTESTMDAVHLMRAATGRMKIIKVEGTYHGHHDSVQVSVYPDPERSGPAGRPYSVPTGPAVPPALAQLTLVVPFGDLEPVERLLVENPGEIAGMIIEPIMMNIGLVPPPDGYLAELKRLLHRHGAYLAFDEVKTGLAVSRGGAVQWSGVVPDLLCLAKALAGGIPCGAIGGVPELMGMISDGTYEQVGTFNGNPLTMAAARAMLFDILDDGAYRHFERLRRVMSDGAEEILHRYGLPGHVRSYGAKGAVIFHDRPLRDYRDFVLYPDQWGNAHWLYQHNGGVFLPPWGKCEQWTISVQHTEADVRRFVGNLERMAAHLRPR
ncbi:aminotransferase class III-fold pyridoxal phosphate-dependent enzyme [Sphaerisporangium sp. B11E5]|uniref:aspartate aminotransferase family protein n=1 Tax=Sphaerisporangium sp. B11E5 TaxID=3153563 RepID=UPI00325DA361